MQHRTLTLGHSPDPDDAFMFYGLARELIPTRGFRFQHILQDIQTLKFEDGASVSVQAEPVASVKDHDALREWAMGNGFERNLTLAWQTVNSLSKQRLLDGEAPPAGVEMAVRTKTILRRG